MNKLKVVVHLIAAFSINLNEAQLCEHLWTSGPFPFFFQRPCDAELAQLISQPINQPSCRYKFLDE